MLSQSNKTEEGQPDTTVGEAKAQWHRLLTTLAELSPDEVNNLDEEQHALHFILRTYCIPIARDSIAPYLKALQHNKLLAPVDLRALRALLELEKDLAGKQNEGLRLEYIFTQLEDIRLSLTINKEN